MLETFKKSFIKKEGEMMRIGKCAYCRTELNERNLDIIQTKNGKFINVCHECYKEFRDDGYDAHQC